MPHANYVPSRINGALKSLQDAIQPEISIKIYISEEELWLSSSTDTYVSRRVMHA